MRTVSKQTAKQTLRFLSLALAIIMTLSVTAFVTSAAEANGYVFYNQEFGPDMNLEDIADVGITKAMGGANHELLINADGNLYDGNNTTTVDEWSVITLPETAVPAGTKDYTVEVNFRFCSSATAYDSGFHISFGYKPGQTGHKDVALRYKAGGSMKKGQVDQFGTEPLKDVADEWLAQNIQGVEIPGNWVNLKITVRNLRIYQMYATVEGTDPVPVVTSTLNTLVRDGQIGFKHKRGDFEINHIRVTAGAYNTENFPAYSGPMAQRSYSEVVMGIPATKTISVLGYQTSAPVLIPDTENYKFHTRVIFGLESIEYDKYGFEVVKNQGTAKIKEDTVVWTSVNGYDKDGEPTVYGTDFFGVQYLTACVLSDIPAEGTHTFEITPYTVKDGVKKYGYTFTITITNGTVTFPVPAVEE